MTQEAVQITTTPPLPGLQLAQDINKALETLATDFAGSTDPAALAGPYMTWADTGNAVLKRRNAANTDWSVLGPLFIDTTSIATNWFGNNPPSATWPGMTWAQQANGVLVRRNLANTAWVVESTLFRDNTLRIARYLVSGSFTVPDGVTTLYRTSQAPGGGGAAYFDGTAGGSGGGGGASEIKTPVTVTPGQVIAIGIGANGIGGAVVKANGTAGGSITFDAVTIPGGSGGVSGGAAGIGGVAAGFAVGGNGQTYNPHGAVRGGNGGGSTFGAGGLMTPTGNANLGSGYGSGGAGSSNGAGGSGAPGFLILEW